MLFALIILDGFGEREELRGNAVLAANTPYIDSLKQNYPFTTLAACGKAVGLVDGAVGTSETGHLHIGAGRVVRQPLARIDYEIEQGMFYDNVALKKAMAACVATDRPLHVMGLFSDGGVHAHIHHVFAVLEMAKREGVSEVFVHAFADGRDVPEHSLMTYVNQFEEVVSELRDVGAGSDRFDARIVSVCGRYFAMDRDTNDDRTQVAVDLLMGNAEDFGENGLPVFENVQAGVDAAYAPDGTCFDTSDPVKSDYYLPAFMVGDVVGDDDDKDVFDTRVQSGDQLLFVNYRTDRARQITHMFMENAPDVYVTCMSRFEADWDLPVAFEQEKVTHYLGQVLADAEVKQWRVAETEKFAHVTFFMNAQSDAVAEGEEHVLVQSPKCASYDEQPEMSAGEVTEKLLEIIENHDESSDEVIIVNYANGDLVGHSGSYDAAVQACEVLDGCVQKVVDALIAQGGVGILTADHGNADEMLYENGDPKPGHSMSPVPCVVFGEEFALGDGSGAVGKSLRDGGSLIDVAPTLLGLMDIAIPDEMEGKNLIVSSM